MIEFTALFGRGHREIELKKTFKAKCKKHWKNVPVQEQDEPLNVHVQGSLPALSVDFVAQPSPSDSGTWSLLALARSSQPERGVTCLANAVSRTRDTFLGAADAARAPSPGSALLPSAARGLAVQTAVQRCCPLLGT